VPRRRITVVRARVLFLPVRRLSRASHLYTPRYYIYATRGPPARPPPAGRSDSIGGGGVPPKVKIYGPEGIIRVSESSTANYYDITLRNRYYMVTGLSRVHAQPRRPTRTARTSASSSPPSHPVSAGTTTTTTTTTTTAATATATVVYCIYSNSRARD